MAEYLMEFGMTLTLFVTLPILIMLAVFLWLSKPKDPDRAPTAERKIVNGGRCHHKTSNKLEVTAMGDSERFFICEICNTKIKESELT